MSQLATLPQRPPNGFYHFSPTQPQKLSQCPPEITQHIYLGENMEAAGSRLGRASSRYGAVPVFIGPVRRWQKQWVHVSSSPISNKRSNSTGNKHNTFVTQIRRWTPVLVTGDSADTSYAKLRRKLRYTPIVVLEEKKKRDEKSNLEDKASKIDQSVAQETCFRQVSDKSETAIRDLNETTKAWI